MVKSTMTETCSAVASLNTTRHTLRVYLFITPEAGKNTYKHRRRLRSASTKQLDVPTCRRSTIGGRTFPVAGAKLWNGLPSDVTSASSLSVFKNRLKTYLFRRCYETIWPSITFPFPSHYLPPQNSGPRNSFYCLGHFKNVYDDDDETNITSDTLLQSANKTKSWKRHLLAPDTASRRPLPASRVPSQPP